MFHMKHSEEFNTFLCNNITIIYKLDLNIMDIRDRSYYKIIMSKIFIYVYEIICDIDWFRKRLLLGN